METANMQFFNYKLRAECWRDIDLFLKELKAKYVVKKFSVEQCEYESLIFPDHTMTFTTNASSSEINTIFDKIEDSHVMRETVNFEAYYTGDREDYWRSRET